MCSVTVTDRVSQHNGINESRLYAEHVLASIGVDEASIESRVLLVAFNIWRRGGGEFSSDILRAKYGIRISQTELQAVVDYLVNENVLDSEEDDSVQDEDGVPVVNISISRAGVQVASAISAWYAERESGRD